MAISLDGAGWYSRTSFFATTDALTMMCWAYPTTLPTAGVYHNLLGNHAAAGFGVGISIFHTVGSAKWNLGTNSSDAPGSAATADTWAHLACTRNGTSKLLFLNGAQDALLTDSDTVQTTFYAGVDDGVDSGSEWIGRLAAIKIWKAALSEAEIANEMRQILPFRTENLAAFYPLTAGLSDDEVDFSGLAQTLTVAGSGHAAADGPPVPWKLGWRRRYLPGHTPPLGPGFEVLPRSVWHVAAGRGPVMLGAGMPLGRGY